MRPAARLLLQIVVLCACAFASPGQHGDTAAIDKFIAGQGSYKNGQQAEGVRTVLTGDLNDDGIPDAAVLYTLEGQNGTNNYVQYLAVFVRVKGRPVPIAHALVGGKNYRAVEIKAIENGAILCNTLAYAPKDPSCCPTIKRSTRYALQGNKLKELGHK